MFNLLSSTAALAHTYRSCEVPPFDWAVYGNYATGRMYGMAAALTGNHIFAAGFLKSTADPDAEGFTEITDDYGITGPYTSADWAGTSATTVTVDLKS